MSTTTPDNPQLPPTITDTNAAELVKAHPAAATVASSDTEASARGDANVIPDHLAPFWPSGEDTRELAHLQARAAQIEMHGQQRYAPGLYGGIRKHGTSQPGPAPTFDAAQERYAYRLTIAQRLHDEHHRRQELRASVAAASECPVCGAPGSVDVRPTLIQGNPGAHGLEVQQSAKLFLDFIGKPDAFVAVCPQCRPVVQHVASEHYASQLTPTGHTRGERALDLLAEKGHLA